ncbi:DNA-binding protein [Actinoplanes italicus]|uniref:Helix-turn-helix protein n=1 Tax=Actinoplanes italicus TaxID=113567 RepID=A0A2T0K276_9ACTN|nr:helix-turn-helix transcriptional regulator [Actinoplanes italicus]PRX16683.1 helix-turn-helix protein [Actinoplanes italicus]GIE31187.1 DNA-binding protein [Actinoplanes italicus]
MPGLRNAELGAFLRSRRPEGLRLEDVARSAGFSLDYYTRIERGEVDYFADAVLDSIARALELDEPDRLHLLRLARPRTAEQRMVDEQEPVRDSLRLLVEGNTGQSVLLIGRYGDLLAANRLGHALLGLIPGEQVNLARLMFLEPATKDLLINWEQEAVSAAARLRVAASVDPGDPELAALIRDLCVKSDDFARIWAGHPVADEAGTVLEYRHPAAGHVTLYCETLALPGDPGKTLVIGTAEPGSPSAGRLRELG